MRRGRVAACALLLSTLLACRAGGPEPATSPEPPEGTPKLVLFLVIDQCRADYLERFRPLLRYGLARLIDESVVFADAHHDHAWTKTAPGHASLATGTHPRKHGIVSNAWYDREEGKVVDSDEDERYEDGRSPHRLLRPSLADWMKEAWPESRSFGASGKGRGAILPAGLEADAAFWLDDESGRFLTSTYYADEPPAWLEEFHEDAHPDRFFGSLWEPLPETVALGSGYGVEPLDRGPGHTTLPHPVGRASLTPDEFYYEQYYWTPFQDLYLGELGRTLVEREELGADVYPDFLGLSFSALDLVGHRFGPDSPELVDTLLRLDRTLGELLELVDSRVGLEHTVVVLSADHGVTPVPEVQRSRGIPARRFGREERQCVQTVSRRLDETLGEADWLAADFFLNPEAAAEAGIALERVEAEVARLVGECPGIERVYTRSQLLSDEPTDDEMLRLHRNGFHPERSPDIIMQFEPGAVGRTTNTTTHGSPYDYDTHVPWLLRLPGTPPKRVEERVYTVDVAPTIAAVLGLTPPDDLDGEDRSALIER